MTGNYTLYVFRCPEGCERPRPRRSYRRRELALLGTCPYCRHTWTTEDIVSAKDYVVENKTMKRHD